MHKTKLVIFGTSNFIGDIVDCALKLDYVVDKIVINQEETHTAKSIPLEERLRWLSEPPEVVHIDHFVPASDEAYFLAPNTPSKRILVDELSTRFGITPCSLIHPSSYVSRFTEIGIGVFINAGCVIAPGVRIYDHVSVNRGATIGHDTVLHEYVRVMPGVNVGGLVNIGQETTIGIGASVIERLNIGEKSMISAGAVVIADIASSVLAAGVPATIKKSL